MQLMKKEDLKIVFLGTPDFAVESLRRMVDEGFRVEAVVTMPDKPAGRGHRLYQSPVKEFALSRGLRVLQPTNLKDPAFVDELRAIGADLFVVIAFRMLPEVVWTMPRLGTFNLHASLLPRYRGAAPINWAVINGDTETGVTTFFLKHEIDTGDIIAQERVGILPTDNVGTVHDRLMLLGADLTLRTLGQILDGSLTTVPQAQLLGDTEPTPAPKIFPETCTIRWDSPAAQIHNLVRGLSPYPAARSILTLDGTPLGAVKIFETRPVSPTEPLAPGSCLVEGDTLTVGCAGDEAVEILSLQPPGKRRMGTPDFLRGIHATTLAFQPS